MLRHISRFAYLTGTVFASLCFIAAAVRFISHDASPTDIVMAWNLVGMGAAVSVFCVVIDRTT